MPWVLTKAERVARTFSTREQRELDDTTRARLSRLQISARFTYHNFVDGNPIAEGEPHVYLEYAVSDPSDEFLARLARDQLIQLNRVASQPAGDVANLDEFKALVTPPALDRRDPADLEKEQEFNEKRTEILKDVSLLRALERATSFGLAIAKSDDPDIVEAKTRIDALQGEDRMLALSLLG